MAAVEQLPAWVRQSLPPGWWNLALTELKKLPEPQLLAIYRATRLVKGSDEARRAAAAMVDTYRQGVLALVQTYAPKGRSGGDPNIISHPPAQLGVTNRDDNRALAARDQEALSQAWMAFFQAVEGYKPERKAKLMTFASYQIKEALIKQIIESLPQEPHSDDTRKAWDRTLTTWAQLTQQLERAPTPAEVAARLAPDLVPAIATQERAYRAILDVFRVLIDNKVSLGEPDDDAQDHAPLAQPADSSWDPGQLLELASSRVANQAELDKTFAQAAANLGAAQSAGKLLALRIMLNMKDSDLGKQMDFGVYKIKEFINNPTAEISERWFALWTDYNLGRYNLPAQWDELRQWFDPPIQVAELREFYRFSSDAAGWNQPRK